MALDWATDGAGWPNRSLSRFPQAAGRRWHVQRGGAGPGVLFLHGAGGSVHSWAGVLPALSGEAEVFALDLPGQGFSAPAPPNRLRLPAMAEDIAALLRAEAFRPDLIVGHSAGAAIALRLALDGMPLRAGVLGLNAAITPFDGLAGVLFPPLAKLLNLNPFSGWLFSRTIGGAGVERLIAGTGSKIPAAELACYRSLVGDSGHVAATLGMMAGWDLAPLIDALPRTLCPVTLALGLGDRAVPADATRGIARRIPGVRLVELARIGHLMPEEAPAEVLALLRGMLGAA